MEHLTKAMVEAPHIRHTGLSMVLFREEPRDGWDGVAAMAWEVMRSAADRYPLIEIDVHDRPTLAALYDVRTTPTILLLRDGEVLDRVVGPPTKLLLQILLDGRASEGRSGRSPR
jgi:hypothetical protein